MPQSVDNDGAVRGPAPQGNSNVTALPPRRVMSHQSSATDGSSLATKSAPSPGRAFNAENVVSLEIDEGNALRVEVNNVRLLLAEARRSHTQHEKRLERACANLLVSGERIPALDQKSFSMMQEAYLNASTAAIVGSEKIIILEDRIKRLEEQRASIHTDDSTGMSRAA